jgi:hypothetical protein
MTAYKRLKVPNLARELLDLERLFGQGLSIRGLSGI